MSDEEEIETLVLEHFDAMRWGDETEPDWDRFRSDFLPGAILCGAMRPAEMRSLESFIDRMETVARQNLQSFEEQTKKVKLLRFGNIAVAFAVSELLEDGTDVFHDISGYLLIKSEGRWSIMAHAWDQAGPDNPVPDSLRT